MSNFASSMHDRDVRYFLHAYTHLRRHEERGPTIIARGEGVHVYDDAGKRYIEGLAGMWCAALGFGEERLVEAAAAAMRRLGYYHNFNHMNHELGIELAERVIAEGLSVRQVEEQVRRLREAAGRRSRSHPAPSKSPELADLEGRLEQLLGTRVEIVQRRGSRQGGRLVFHYFSDEQLTALCDHLLDDTE